MIQCNSKKNCGKKCYKCSSLFTQFICEDYIVIPDKKPDVEDVISIIVDPEIVSLSIVNTPEGCSAEGQKLSGKKLSIEIKIREKILYVSKRETQSVHVVEKQHYKSAYIIVPKLINGSEVEQLLNQKYINVEVKVESTSAIKVDERNIYKSIMLFIEAKVNCNYLLCYTEDYKCYENELYMTYDDGSKKRKIAHFKEGKILMPKWSPYGQRIACICKKRDTSCIYLIDSKLDEIYEITDKSIFKYVSDFSWGVDGKSIIFTAQTKNNKDIFYINLNTLEWKQITYGKDACDSMMPKYSLDGEHIAYIRIAEYNSSLHIVGKNGLGEKKIIELEEIVDFAWEASNSKIAVVCKESHERTKDNERNYCLGFEKRGNEIILVDLKLNKKISLGISEYNLNIKEIKISQDNRYISFIGESLETDDIYLYDLLENKIINITENEYGIKIGDYDWNIDSSGIYYSCNELDYYNVYFAYLCNKTKLKISNTNASRIQLSYRPKII